MNSDNYRFFSPRRGFRQSLPFIMIFGFFIILGIIPLSFGMTGAGLAVIGMGLFFYALILPQAAAAGRRYGIGGSGIILKSAFNSLAVPFDGIDSAALLSKCEGCRFMEELYRASAESERQMDIGAWYRSKRRSADVVRYLSVPVTGVEMRRGHLTDITSYSVRTSAELILLRLKMGGRILISPADAGTFYSELLSRGIAVQPAAAGEGMQAQSGITPSRNISRTLITISYISFAVLLALVTYFFIFPAVNETPSGGVPKEPVVETEASDAVLAAWLNDDSYIFGVPKDELPGIEGGGAVTADLFIDYAAPRLIWLYETDGELSEGTLGRIETVSKTGQFLLLHSRMTSAGEETSDGGEVYSFFVVERAGMRESFASLIRNF